GWRLAEPGRALEVETSGEVVWFRARFLDHHESIREPLVLRFGLQPGPVKPVSFGWRANARILHDIHYDSCRPGTNADCELDRIAKGGARTVVIHDSWTSYFGQMIPADAARFRELIEACHKRGLRLLVYVGYGLARNAPEMQGHHDEWSVLPLIPWDPGYKPRERGFDATCANSGWADWLVAGTEKLFSEFDLDGLYFDGTSEAWRCQNQTHGCGWKDASANVHPVYPILAARQLMRRMAAAVRRHKPDAILDVHMSSNLTLPTLSFCDSLWNGEQFEGHTSGEKFQVPLHVFRTEFMGYAHGMDMEFLCYENRPFTFDEAITLGWLHGIEVRPYPQTLSHVTPIWRAMDQFGVARSKWQPYWSGSGATSPEPSVQISAWIRKNKALLFVSHLQRTNETVRIVLDGKKLGVELKRSQAWDALSGESLTLRNEAMEIPFSGMSYRMVVVKAKVNR
ncbi:MAG TPA: glycoside hydrolase domain-containing protein, partial [Candidatus Dormibacteraeota bacterium]|nr:glycoside hydrolase domain-containing protein [Candidatus Dormibacteraeota bacterium]